MSSDVASILEGAQLGGGVTASTTASSEKKLVKKPKGMSREVFALLDPSALTEGVPPVDVMPAAGQRKFKIDPAKKVRQWEFAEFQNSARGDGYKLKHWQRKQVVLDDYAFTRFNKAPYIPLYSEEQYAALVAPLADAAWSRADTDQLFMLCRRYDLRWPVIHDRFNPVRPLADLKQRYFQVAQRLCLVPAAAEPCKALLGDLARTAHPSGKLVSSARAALADFRFDAALEREHASRHEALFTRTKEDEAEETRLAAEFKRVDAELKRVLQEEKASPAVPLIEAAAVASTSQQCTLRSTQMDKRPNAVGVGKRMTKKMGDLMDALEVPASLLPSLNVAAAFNALRLDAVKLLALEKAKLAKQAELAALQPSADYQPTLAAAAPIPAPAAAAGVAVGVAVAQPGSAAPSPQPTPPAEDRKRKAGAMASASPAPEQPATGGRKRKKQ